MNEIHEFLTVLIPFESIPAAAADVAVERLRDHGATFSRIDLDGTYHPPMGIAGAIIDAAVGHHFAVSGARSLLNDIKNGLEAAHNTGVAP